MEYCWSRFKYNGFVTSVLKPAGNNSSAIGTVYTEVPLNDKYGYLGIYEISFLSDFYIKFGSNQSLTTSGNNDYGYYIASGKIYPIIKGTVATESVTTQILVNKIEIEKRDNIILLRINGSRIDESQIIIDKTDEDKHFYSGIGIKKANLDSKFNLRHGGFVDTGNRVELSYSKYRAKEFKNNDQGKSFLVIDRSGTGVFNESDTEYITSDEIDLTREKIIFNNVFFDTDGNGTDVFTFAYQESNLGGEINIVDPSCNGTDGIATIKLTSGTRAFKYTLTDLNSGTVVKEGRENSYTINLMGLKGGDYEIKIEEAGGFNVVSENPSGTASRAKTTNFFPVFEGGLEWMVTNTTDTYMIGYTTFVENVNNSKNIIHYGLKKNGNKIYKIVGGKLESTNTTVDVGDVIRVAKTMNNVTYFKNGVEFSSSGIKWYDYLLKFYGLIDISEGPAEILNVNATGFFNLADYNWSTTNGINVNVSENAVLTYQFSLIDPCDSDLVPTEQTPDQIPTEDKMRTYTVPGTKLIKASLELDEPDVVSFTAYSINGALVKKINLSIPRKLQEADFDFSSSGVYIIKAITTNGEFSKKVIVQ